MCIFKEIVEDLAKRGGAINPVKIEGEKFSPHGWTGQTSNLTYGVPFDPVQMTVLLDEKMLEAGVDVIYFTSMVDVHVQNNRVTQIIIFNKGGLQAMMKPATLMFHVNNVD